MRLLIDANILLDVLQKREPHYQASSLIWKLCETQKAIGYVSALTFANIIYILKKELTEQKIAEVFSMLSLIFTFTELSVSDIQKAALMQWKDFEDAIQTQTAIRLKVDYIVTRNVKDYRNSQIPAFTPSELLERIDIY